jgi:phosphoheptose isomerase
VTGSVHPLARPGELSRGVGWARPLAHLDALDGALPSLRSLLPQLEWWADQLLAAWRGGGRALVAGNGGSAALAEHLTAELVGRYQGERAPWSAVALTGDTAALTAISNDYGYHEVFARQVRAHGRRGDVLVLMSTSGRSSNLLAAAEVAHDIGACTLAMTGASSSPLARCCDDTVRVPGPAPVVQELQQVVVHLLCELLEERSDAR